uniref:Uncharacterized protein n=1 Tax=Rhizophora mucronata TaxID=61149 RepID=A0A2P2LCB9_RHIMU
MENPSRPMALTSTECILLARQAKKLLYPLEYNLTTAILRFCKESFFLALITKNPSRPHTKTARAWLFERNE